MREVLWRTTTSKGVGLGVMTPFFAITCITNLRNWQQITYHTLSFMSLVRQQCQLKYLLTAEQMEPHRWKCFHSKIDVCSKTSPLHCSFLTLLNSVSEMDGGIHIILDKEKIFLNSIFPRKMEIPEKGKYTFF